MTLPKHFLNRAKSQKSKFKSVVNLLQFCILHFVFCIFLFLIPLITFAKVEDSREKLSKILGEIKKTEAHLKTARERKEKTQVKISETSRNQGIQKKNLQRIDTDIKKISKKIDITKEIIAGLAEKIKGKKAGLSFVVKELWNSRTLKSPFFKQPSQEKEGLLDILINDLSLSIQEREEEKKKEVIKKEGLGIVLDKTGKQKKEIISNIKKAEQEISLQNKVLSEVKKDEIELTKKIARLKQDQKKLEGLIARMEAERKKLPKESSPSKPVGSLIWPTKSRNIVREFGKYTHPEAGTIMINKGIDISAVMGSSVFAVSDGEVVYADFFMGYGKLIMIDHNGSLYSLYAHLDRMDVGIQDKVTKGQTIGSVGKSQDAESPILHFEIRLNGEAKDPMDWLR